MLAPKSLRYLLSTIFDFNRPANRKQLWQEFEEFLIEDFLYQGSSVEVARKRALNEIEVSLNCGSQSLLDFGFSVGDFQVAEAEVIWNITETDISNFISSLNHDQKLLWEVLVARIGIRGGYFFLDGPGGSGKTYFENGLINYCRFR